MEDPASLSATEMRSAIGAKALSPVDLVEACLRRTEAENGRVNAVVTLCADRAMEEARAAEQVLMTGRRLGPLHGVPFAVKDLNDTAGVRTTYGSTLYTDNVPRKDAGLVARLRQAGAILIGKTNTPEFGAGANTRNEVFGATGNPLDARLTCGGSSGGSAVALACEMMPLATGSDTGGSLRIPAAMSGVVGMRPSPGLVADEGRTLGWTTFGVEGPMARTVADTALMLSVMAATDPLDPMSGAVDVTGLGEPGIADLASLKVAVSEDLGCAPVDNGIRERFRAMAAVLSPMVGRAEWSDPTLKEADRVFDVLRAQAFVASYGAVYDRTPEALGPNVSSNVELGLRMTLADTADAVARHTRLYRRFLRFMDRYDVLICPASATPPFPVEEWYPATINGQSMDTYYRWLSVTYALTLTAHPVVVVPCGVDHTGMPFGIQICGRKGQDRRVLAIAAAIEQFLGSIEEWCPARPPRAG